MKHVGVQRMFGLIATILSAIVAICEFVFYVNHTYRHGPAIYIAILAVAIFVLA